MKSITRSVIILLKKRLIINALYIVVLSLFFNQLLAAISSFRDINYYVRSISGSKWNNTYALGFYNELGSSARFICPTNEQLPSLATELNALENIQTAWNPVVYNMEIQGEYLNGCDYSNPIGRKMRFNITGGREPGEDESNVVLLPDKYAHTFKLDQKYTFKINDFSNFESRKLNRFIEVELRVIGFYSNAITFSSSSELSNDELKWYLKTNSSNDAIIYNLTSDRLSEVRGDIMPLVFVETSDIDSVLASKCLEDELVVFSENMEDFIYEQKDQLGNTVEKILQKLFEYLFVGLLLTTVDILMYTGSETSYIRISYLLGRTKRESILLASLSRFCVILVGMIAGLIIYINNLSVGTTGGISLSNKLDGLSLALSLMVMIIYSLFTFAICFLLGKENNEYG